MTDLFTVVADPSLLARFWAKVDRSGECWTWTACTNRHGYGQFGIRRRHYLAHRVSYALAHGPFDTALYICHSCDNPPCVRPDHLFVGTQLDNMRDASGKGRTYSVRKTHCVRGHALEGDNLKINSAGSRSCRTCLLDRQRERRAKAKLLNPGPGTGSHERAKTHCPQGHPYDDVNTYVTPKGSRMCKACQRIRHREWMAQQRQKASAS